MQQDLIERINAYMQENPYHSRTQLIKAVGIGIQRAKKLEAEGLIKLPLKQSFSAAGTKSRAIARKAGKKWATWSVKP